MFLKLAIGVVGNDGVTLAVSMGVVVAMGDGGGNTRETEKKFCSHDGAIHVLFTIANTIAIAVAILTDVANSVAVSIGVVTVKVR